MDHLQLHSSMLRFPNAVYNMHLLSLRLQMTQRYYVVSNWNCAVGADRTTPWTFFLGSYIFRSFQCIWESMPQSSFLSTAFLQPQNFKLLFQWTLLFQWYTSPCISHKKPAFHIKSLSVLLDPYCEIETYAMDKKNRNLYCRRDCIEYQFHPNHRFPLISTPFWLWNSHTYIPCYHENQLAICTRKELLWLATTSLPQHISAQRKYILQ